MTNSIIHIIGDIMGLMYLVIGFIWFWKRIVKLIFKLFHWIIKKNAEIRMENDKFTYDLFNDLDKQDDND